MLISIIGSMIYALPIYVICAVQLFPLFCPEDAGKFPALAGILFLIICALFRHGSLKVRLMVVAAVIAPSVGLFFAVDSEERPEFFSERLWVLPVFLAVLASFVLGELISAYRLLRLAASALIIAALVFLAVRGIDPGPLTTTMCFMPVLSAIISEVEYHWKKEGDRDIKKHMVSLLPFILLCCIIVLASPSSEDPYGWPVAKRIWQFAKDTITRIEQYFASDEDCMDIRIGFSDQFSGISGDITSESDNEEMFKVSFKNKETPPMNLGACGYNEFNGTDWSNTVAGDSVGLRASLDNIETRASLVEAGISDVSDHMRYIEANVTYTGLNTRYALLPGKFTDAMSRGALLDTMPANGNTVFAEKHGLGTTYSFRLIKLNKNHSDFIDLLNGTGRPVTSPAWYDTVADVFQLAKNDYPYEDYLSYVESIKANYLRSVTPSPALREKLDALYEGCSGAYEKMLRLEAVLGRFSYTLTPGEMPDYVNSPESFLDHFMLEDPRGYCSHFATAMVLLARAEGLPARYVEGFCISPSSSGGTTVTNGEAHAWAEIYFEGFGFIPFDPTPGHAAQTAWQTASERAAYLASLSQGSLEAFMSAPSDSPQNAPEVETEPEGEVSAALIIIPVLMCLLLFPAAILLYKAIAVRRFNRLSVTEKSVYLCHANMRLLRFLGAGLSGGETLSEFALREKETLPEDLTDFITTYEEISYSNKEVSEEMLSSLISSNKRISAYASKKRRLAYFFHNCINL
ncbi:MAG: transglutaminase-like domain-containing protein [Lachnospiraceae bacterium]|nr:transglutaminase-like domain-containing protein [Lachnospiraceae bacterium]